jgi:hypothetical protein
MTATVKWNEASKELPDSDIEVLIAVSDASNQGEVWVGYHDGNNWRSCSGGIVGVSHWADLPLGPQST